MPIVSLPVDNDQYMYLALLGRRLDRQLDMVNYAAQSACNCYIKRHEMSWDGWNFHTVKKGELIRLDDIEKNIVPWFGRKSSGTYRTEVRLDDITAAKLKEICAKYIPDMEVSLGYAVMEALELYRELMRFIDDQWRICRARGSEFIRQGVDRELGLPDPIRNFKLVVSR